MILSGGAACLAPCSESRAIMGLCCEFCSTGGPSCIMCNMQGARKRHECVSRFMGYGGGRPPGSHDFQPVTEQIEDALRGINWHEGGLSEMFGFRDSYYNFDGWGDLTARTICRRAAREVLGIAGTQSIALKPKAAPLRTQITEPLALGMKSEVPSHRQPGLEHL